MLMEFFLQSKSKIHYLVVPEYLERPAGVVPGRAGERQLQGQLRPPLVEVRMGKGVGENRHDVLQEHIDLVGRTDRPVGARYVLVLPEGLTLSENRNEDEDF